MSKLNEEIIDVLQDLTEMTKRGSTEALPGTDLRPRRILERAQLLLDFFIARRHIEECRREEDEF